MLRPGDVPSLVEHLASPRESLCAAVRLLAPEGTILIRIPVMGCFAWRLYGSDWIQLNPPRHLCMFTPMAMGV